MNFHCKILTIFSNLPLAHSGILKIERQFLEATSKIISGVCGGIEQSTNLPVSLQVARALHFAVGSNRHNVVPLIIEIILFGFFVSIIVD